MKTIFLIPALALTLSPLHATPTFPATSPGGQFAVSANDGVFVVAQNADPNADPDPAPAPTPTPTPAPITSLNITGAGLLDFVFQQLYAGLSAEEADLVRAVLAPQYAALADFIQGAFNGADQVTLPPDVSADPLPAADPNAATGNVSVTQAMAVVAATTLLAEPGVDTPNIWETMAYGPGGRSSAPLFITTMEASAVLDEPVLTLGGTQTFDVTAVPEPSTMLLAAAGLAMAFRYRRS